MVTELSRKLNGKVTVVNLKEDKNPDFAEYDRVIIGGSIHAGKIQQKIREFCDKNIEELGEKALGLFICCMETGEKAQQQLNNAFSEKLHQYAKTEAILGGEFNFEKMRYLEKLIVKKIAKVNESVDKIDHESIDRFAKKFDKTFSPMMLLI